jgi:hypothetical protein
MADERWATLLQKQEEKMLIEKERVAVKKCKEDFLLLTASMIGMDPRVLVAHNFYKDMIHDEIDAKMAATASAPAAASASTPASASATTPATASATASASTPVMALASTPMMTSGSTPAMASAADRAEFVGLDGPAPTQEAPPVSPNPFFQ